MTLKNVRPNSYVFYIKLIRQTEVEWFFICLKFCDCTTQPYNGVKYVLYYQKILTMAEEERELDGVTFKPVTNRNKNAESRLRCLKEPDSYLQRLQV